LTDDCKASEAALDIDSVDIDEADRFHRIFGMPNSGRGAKLSFVLELVLAVLFLQHFWFELLNIAMNQQKLAYSTDKTAQ
jgi:hypothetical protein